MSNFKADNPLQRIDLPLEALCCLSAVVWPDTIRPENVPLLIEVEPVREKGAPADAKQVATRYNVVFPGSDYLRGSIKVEESTPSVAPEVLKKYPRGIPVHIEGLKDFKFLTKDGGVMIFFKAAKITLIQAQAQPAR